MKILFLGELKGGIKYIADAINAHTEHEALVWERMKRDDKNRVVACPMTNPDIIINVSGYVTYEMEQAMGLVKRARKRILYLLGAPKGRGGIWAPNWCEWFYNDNWATQCVADADALLKKDGTSMMDASDPWLPVPLDITFEAATQPAIVDRPKVGMTLSVFASQGLWDKGIVDVYSLYDSGVAYLDLIQGVTREVALARKATCNMVFDSDKGNIGVSGLESLAQGIPVIAKLDPKVLACFEDLGADFPVITYTDRADLAAKVAAYTPEQLVTLGEQSRAWMQANYTAEKLAQYWTTKLSTLDSQDA